MTSLKLAILSPRIRADLHDPLHYFQKISVRHYYIQGSPENSARVPKIKLPSLRQFQQEIRNWNPDLIQAPEPFFGLRLGKWFRWIEQSRFSYFLPWLETRSPRRKFGIVLGSIWRARTRRYVENAEFIWPVTSFQRSVLKTLNYRTRILSPHLWGSWGTRVPPAVKPRDRFDQKRFIFLGRLEEEKGIRDLLRAWPTVCARTDWKLDIAGTGSQVERVRRAADACPRVRYRGFVPWNSLESVWRHVSVMVSPSRSRPGWEEQVGMSNIQALGRGIPVISTWSGAIPQIIDHQQTGLLTLPESPRSLARLMIGLAENFDRYRGLSTEARGQAEKRFDREKVIASAEQRLLEEFENGGSE